MTILIMRKNIFLLLTVVLLFVGCTMQNAYHETLERAKRLINERPDSALELLDSIFPYQNTFSKSMHMDYMLQRLNAQNKCDTIFRSDSTAKILVDYYNHHGTSNQRMLANYLAGRVYYDMGELPHALHYYQCAVEAADTIRSDCDLYTLYAVYGQMAELFHAQLLPDNEMEALLAAERCAWKDHDTLSALTAYELRFRPYYLKNEKDSVLLILNRVHDLFIKYGHRKRAAQTLPSIISISLDQGKYEKAHELMLSYEKESGLFDKNGEIMDGFEIYYYEKGRYATFKHETDSAVYYFTKLLDAGQFEAGYKGLLQVYQMRGNPDSIAKYATLYAAANDSSFLHVNQRQVEQVRANYNYNRQRQLAEKRKQEARNWMMGATGTVMVALLILSILLLYLYRFKARRLQEINNLKEKKENLELLLQKKEVSDEEIKREILRLINKNSSNSKIHKETVSRLQTQIDILQRKLLETMQPTKIDPALERFIIEFKNKLHEFHTDDKPPSESEWALLKKAFSSNHHSAYQFVTSPHNITEDQIRICLMTMLDISESMMAVALSTDSRRVDRVKRQANKKLFGEDNASKLKSNLRPYFS